MGPRTGGPPLFSINAGRWSGEKRIGNDAVKRPAALFALDLNRDSASLVSWASVVFFASLSIEISSPRFLSYSDPFYGGERCAPVKTEEKRSWADEEKEAAAPPSQAADEASPRS
ncbi:hypothetical protein OPV22_022677 [Ensete ventricosum]|uniref:Uncharacterized protein n=1 Tax=Ensete ventricosum TaxID=4639 RepID=A0AAV8QLS2_ENSVE|nr:hypothetical protein OPV22_022677 [Ensete ventricosum]